jgi:hypothetical protein
VIDSQHLEGRAAPIGSPIAAGSWRRELIASLRNSTCARYAKAPAWIAPRCAGPVCHLERARNVVRARVTSSRGANGLVT